ncbi:MAG: phosphonate ABC transporter, permease protein PhnE [Rhodospirillales bacterium]|nr:phosphonate ABC transporter, permease protein PhnE [Rhodospirillales bacterium]
MTNAAITGNPLRDPKKIARKYISIAIFAVIVLYIGKIIILDGTDWERLGSVEEVIKTVLFFVPDFAFFPETVVPLLETLLIAFWGTALAVILCLPIAYMAARNVTPFPWITYPLGRCLIVLSRSTHEIIFALIYISALGLGPLPGILALASRSLGFMAKTTSEAIENASPGPIEAMEALGANRFLVFFYGVMPQIFPIFVGNVIFQLDINIRRASILGLVGGGGIGLMFAQVMQNLQYDRAGTIVVGITSMVIIGEFISNRIRARLV